MNHEHDWVQVGTVGNMVVCSICGEPGWWFDDEEADDNDRAYR